LSRLKGLSEFCKAFIGALSVGKDDGTPGAKEIRKVLDDSIKSAFAF
jgi:hypothetical protein